MSILKKGTKGPVSRPHLVLVYGPEGVGKSTFASGFPAPFFLDVEKGTMRLNVDRAHPETYADFLGALNDLEKEKHEYKTVVIDSLSRLETMLWHHVCENNFSGKVWSSIEDPGYGKGYVAAGEEWEKLVLRLEKFQEKTGMGLVLIAHSEMSTFQDPVNNVSYTRYQLELHKTASATIKKYVENIFFINHDTVTKQEKNEKNAKAYGAGERVMYTEHRPAFDAKNRLGLPFTLAPTYSAIAAVNPTATPVETPPPPAKSTKLLRAEIEKLLKKTDDKVLKEKVELYVRDNPEDVAKLEATIQRLKTVLGIGEEK